MLWALEIIILWYNKNWMNEKMQSLHKGTQVSSNAFEAGEAQEYASNLDYSPDFSTELLSLAKHCANTSSASHT